jgi:hypothetical protein
MVEKPLKSHGALSALYATKSKPAWIGLEWIEERTDNRSSWVAVTLNLNGELVTALSPALPLKQSRHGVGRTALATLKAIELLVHHQFSCELLDVELVHALKSTLIMVRVRLTLDDETVELFGSARVVDHDFLDAAARAALDATNLYIDSILSYDER